MFYKHLLLSNDVPFERVIANRKRGDWFHSIVVLTEREIPENGDVIDCIVLHFHGENGSPVLETNQALISCKIAYKNRLIYRISLWVGICIFPEKIRTGNNSYEDGYGHTDLNLKKIIETVSDKWGKSKIPYIHRHKESYNCIGFSDDVIHFLRHGKWNPRIIENHAKYQLMV
jgi:hypothetical protein